MSSAAPLRASSSSHRNQQATTESDEDLLKSSISSSLHRYKIKQPLGKGAGSFVWWIQDYKTGAEYALKSIVKQSDHYKHNSHRIANEFKLHSQLDHPNVVKMYKNFEDCEYVYMMMEFCEGGNLFEYFKSKGRLSEEEVMEITYQVVLGLEYLHNNKIIHRDLKPGNIVLTGKNTVKICDFGLAVRLLDFESERDTFCGTPNYIAPREPYGMKSDCWSFGCILYSLVTGRPPFETMNVQDTLKVLQKRPQVNIPKHLSKQLVDLLSHILDWNSDTRYSIQQIKNHPFYSKMNEKQQKQTAQQTPSTRTSRKSSTTQIPQTTSNSTKQNLYDIQPSHQQHAQQQQPLSQSNTRSSSQKSQPRRTSESNKENICTNFSKSASRREPSTPKSSINSTLNTSSRSITPFSTKNVTSNTSSHNIPATPKTSSSKSTFNNPYEPYGSAYAHKKDSTQITQHQHTILSGSSAKSSVNATPSHHNQHQQQQQQQQQSASQTKNQQDSQTRQKHKSFDLANSASHTNQQNPVSNHQPSSIRSKHETPSSQTMSTKNSFKSPKAFFEDLNQRLASQQQFNQQNFLSVPSPSVARINSTNQRITSSNQNPLTQSTSPKPSTQPIHQNYIESSQTKPSSQPQQKQQRQQQQQLQSSQQHQNHPTSQTQSLQNQGNQRQSRQTRYGSVDIFRSSQQASSTAKRTQSPSSILVSQDSVNKMQGVPEASSTLNTVRHNSLQLTSRSTTINQQGEMSQRHSQTYQLEQSPEFQTLKSSSQFNKSSQLDTMGKSPNSDYSQYRLPPTYAANKKSHSSTRSEQLAFTHGFISATQPQNKSTLRTEPFESSSKNSTTIECFETEQNAEYSTAACSKFSISASNNSFTKGINSAKSIGSILVDGTNEQDRHSSPSISSTQQQQQKRQPKSHNIPNYNQIDSLNMDNNAKRTLSPIRVTDDLDVAKISTQNGLIEITADRSLIVQSFNGRLLFKISRNGTKIQINKLVENPIEKHYDLDRLPSKYYAMYCYAKRVVKVLQKKTIISKLEIKEGVFTLLENDSFEASFKTGFEVFYRKRSNKMWIRISDAISVKAPINQAYKDILPREFDLSNPLTGIPEELSLVISKSLKYFEYLVNQSKDFSAL